MTIFQNLTNLPKLKICTHQAQLPISPSFKLLAALILFSVSMSLALYKHLIQVELCSNLSFMSELFFSTLKAHPFCNITGFYILRLKKYFRYVQKFIYVYNTFCRVSVHLLVRGWFPHFSYCE